MAKALKKVCCFKLKFEPQSVSDDASILKQFFETKIMKHAGFIIESVVEGMAYMVNRI